MQQLDYLTKLLGIQGFRVSGIEIRQTKGIDTVVSYKRFAKMIDNHIEGILCYCDKKVSLGYIEGTNLKAKNIIRRAYGYRDKEYIKLKIIQGCPSIGIFKPYPYPLHHDTG